MSHGLHYMTMSHGLLYMSKSPATLCHAFQNQNYYTEVLETQAINMPDFHASAVILQYDKDLGSNIDNAKKLKHN